MKTKFNVFDKLKVFKSLVENKLVRILKQLNMMEVGSITLKISMHFAKRTAL
jgi:hypothetical protein